VAQVRHAITYRSIIVDIYVAEVRGSIAGNRLRWFTASRLPRSAVSSLARKIAEKIGFSNQLFLAKAGGA
jgi:hypothetical protein